MYICFIKIMFYLKDIFDTTIYFYHRGTRTNTSSFVETHFRRLLASMWMTAWPRNFFYVFAPSPLTLAGLTRWVLYMWTGKMKLESESDPWPWLVWRGELYVKKGKEIRKWKWSLIPAGYMWTAGLTRSVISDLGQWTFKVKLIFKFLIPSGLMNDDSAKGFSNSLSQGCCGCSQRASAEWEVSIGLQALCRISQGIDFVLVIF